MSHANIRKAFVDAYRDGNFFPDARTAYENFTFTPPANAAWGKVTLLIGGTAAFSLGPPGAGGSDRCDGIFQIDINYPLNSGTEAADLKFVAIRDAFFVGRKISYGGQTVVCRAASPSPGRIADGYWRISATIPFYSLVNR